MLKVSLGGLGPILKLLRGCVRAELAAGTGVSPGTQTPSPCKGTRLGGGCSSFLDAACPRLSKVEPEFVHLSRIPRSLSAA